MAIYSLAAIILTLNYFLAFPFAVYEGNLGSILFNGIRFVVYVFVGWGITYYASQTKGITLVFSVLLFLYEHAILKIIHLEILGKRAEIVEGFNTLIMSFFMFMPIVMLLVYVGILVSKYTKEKRASPNYS